MDPASTERVLGARSGGFRSSFQGPTRDRNPFRHGIMRPSVLARASLATLGLALLAVSAEAQELTPGISTGTLLSTDPTLNDGTHWQSWALRGEAGQRFAITLRSDDFDAFLLVGDAPGDDCFPSSFCEVDDDGAEGTDARVRVTLPRSGTFHVTVNTVFSGETGLYTLQLVELPPPLPPRGELAPGRAVTGVLGEESDVTDVGGYFDGWTFRARAGERLVLTLRSRDFDAYLKWGRSDDEGFMLMGENDDGGDGTDSRLEIVVPAEGVYLVRAGSFFAGETGEYTLLLERM